MLYPLASKVIVQTRYIEHVLNKMFVLNTMIIPNSVSVPQIQARSFSASPHAPTLVSVGSLTPQKNFFVLIESMRFVLQVENSVQLILLGNGPLRLHLENFALDIGVAGNVCFRGRVDDVTDYLSAADIYVHPSSYEGFPNALLEAMAVGVPCIASQKAGHMLIDHGVDGELLQKCTAHSLSSSILRLLMNPSRRKMYSTAAIQKALTFSDDLVLPRWRRLLVG